MKAKVIIANGNKFFPEVESGRTPSGQRIYQPPSFPKMLEAVAAELGQIRQFDLTAGLRDMAKKWREPTGQRPWIWEKRIKTALECDLSPESKDTLADALERLQAHLEGPRPPIGDPYELYADGEVFRDELRKMVNGEMDRVKLAAIHAQLEAEVAA